MENLYDILWLSTLDFWLFALVSWYDPQNISLIHIIFEDTSWYCLDKSVLMPQLKKIFCASLFLEIKMLIRKWMSTGINILQSWYWLVTINLKIFLDIFPSIQVFVTSLTDPNLVLRPFYTSIKCLHNPISYWYLTILDASSHIFKNHH